MLQQQQKRTYTEPSIDMEDSVKVSVVGPLGVVSSRTITLRIPTLASPAGSVSRVRVPRAVHLASRQLHIAKSTYGLKSCQSTARVYIF